MKFKTLSNKSFKKIANEITISIVLFSVLILSLSLAKYRNTISINVAKGTINYKIPDVNTVALYIADDTGTYNEAKDIPTSGYTLNNEPDKTRCEVDKVRDEGIDITYNNGKIDITGISKKGTKCYLYFDKSNILTPSEIIPDGTTTTESMFAGTSGDGIYIWTKGDYSGGDQPIKYFRGNIDNNWVVFGKDGSNYIWWRIIRNNSNDSLRMVYAGTNSSKTNAPTTTGEDTHIGTSAFNSAYNDNMYVGFKYTSGEVHGAGTNSTILDQLETWYNKTIGKNTEYSNKIDVNAGFCNDRTPHSGTGTGTTATNYAAYNRLANNKAPSLLCTNVDDIFKTNVGLITADEVQISGMIYDSPKNTTTYLYTNTNYWTMSPSWFNSKYSHAGMFFMQSDGCIYDAGGRVASTYGIRPVVNLKADTLFEKGGTGLANNPYIVQGT